MKHLAVLHKSPLEKILSGEKTIESRFSKNQAPPFRKVEVGDTILLKEVSGPVRGSAKVSRALFFTDLTTKSVREIFYRHKGIRAEGEFIRDKLDSKFATLLFLEGVKEFDPPLQIKKKDRRAWVILDSPTQQSLGLSSLP